MPNLGLLFRPIWPVSWPPGPTFPMRSKPAFLRSCMPPLAIAVRSKVAKQEIEFLNPGWRQQSN